ncbi:hypothetical protein [Streptomyces sp. NPDC088915]|uniref:hypothetical protein n=1 Tax=Streptomyces sp. NPDC088915 TaxID=3365912 RepID=UPI0038265490
MTPPQEAHAGYTGAHGPYVSFIEQLLSFGTAHVLQHDLLASPALTTPKGAPEVTVRAATALSLAGQALALQEKLAGLPLHQGRTFRSVQARLRQLAMLATDSSEALVNAADALAPIRRITSLEELASPWAMEARRLARDAVAAGRDFMAFGAQDCLAAAEALAADLRQRGSSPSKQPTGLSPAQHAGLRAIALGHVAVSDDKTVHLHGDSRPVAIATIRSLEARGLTTREVSPLHWFWSRCIPTADGHRALAAMLTAPASFPPASAPAARPTRRTAHTTSL